MSLDLDDIRDHLKKYATAIGPGGEKAWWAGVLAADVPALLAAIERLTAERDQLRDKLREQWAALYDDRSWTSGQDETRAEAEEIIAESVAPVPPVLARRWVGDWHLAPKEVKQP